MERKQGHNAQLHDQWYGKAVQNSMRSKTALLAISLPSGAAQGDGIVGDAE